jgi:phosphatidylglycerol:prolipoprotein diacylglycerol transferase
MRPVLFHWRAFTVPSYPAMLYFGLVAGVLAGNAAAHAAGLNAWRAYIATLLLIVPALIGSRLLHVAYYWRSYRHNLRRIWNRNEGGCAMYGGFILALVVSIPLLHAFRLSFWAFWDVAEFTILVGMIFARIGCLLNGCCAGRPSTVLGSLCLPNCAGIWKRRIPTQLLEAGWAGVLLVTAMISWPRMPFPGALFLLVTAGYGAGRLMLESAREEAAGRFTIYHAISVVLIVLAATALALNWGEVR